MRRKLSFETLQRNWDQMKNRTYQRTSMNWKIGMLTKAYQYPASVRCKAIPSGFAYQLEDPVAISLRHTHRPSVYTSSKSVSSTVNELRIRFAESMAAWNFVMSAETTSRRSTNLLTMGTRREWTITSA